MHLYSPMQKYQILESLYVLNNSKRVLYALLFKINAPLHKEHVCSQNQQELHKMVAFVSALHKENAFRRHYIGL